MVRIRENSVSRWKEQHVQGRLLWGLNEIMHVKYLVPYIVHSKHFTRAAVTKMTITDRPHCVTVFSKYCITKWEKQSLEGGMVKVYVWAICGLTKMLQINWWLTSTIRSSLFGEWEKQRGCQGSLSRLSKGGTEEVHRPTTVLIPTSLLVWIHNLGFSDYNLHTFTDCWAHGLRQLREWLNVTGPCGMAEIKTQVSWLTFIHLLASTVGPSALLRWNLGQLRSTQNRLQAQEAMQSSPFSGM